MLLTWRNKSIFLHSAIYQLHKRFFPGFHSEVHPQNSRTTPLIDYKLKTFCVTSKLTKSVITSDYPPNITRSIGTYPVIGSIVQVYHGLMLHLLHLQRPMVYGSTDGCNNSKSLVGIVRKEFQWLSKENSRSVPWMTQHMYYNSCTTSVLTREGVFDKVSDYCGRRRKSSPVNRWPGKV